MKRILAIIIAFFLFLSTFVPFVFADYSSQPCNFWDRYLYQWSHQGDGLGLSLGPFSIPLDRFGTLACHLSTQLCASSDDHLHHADSIQQGTYRTDSDGHGCALCTCKYCGQDFIYRSDDLRQDYQTYLHDNSLDNGLSVTPATNDSPSGLIWRPTFSDFDNTTGSSLYFCAYFGSGPQQHNISYPNGHSESYRHWGNFSESSFEYYELCNSSTRYYGSNIHLVFSVPVAGYYSLIQSVFCSVDSYSSYYNPSGFSPVYADSSLSFDYYEDSSSVRYYCSLNDYYCFSYHLPVFRVVPSDSISVPSVPQNITINNNTYPVTSINFNTRTVISEGDTKIEYGDTEIKIYEGDTVTQTINYIIENDDPGTDPGNGYDSSTSVDPGTVATGSDVSGGSGASGCCEQCALLLRQVNSYLLQIQTLVDQINDKLGPESDNYMEGIYNLLVEINTALDNLPTEPHKDYEAKLTSISNQLANIWGDLDTIKTSLSAVQTNTATTNQKLDTVHADLQAVLAELQTQRGILSQILSVLRDMLGHITSIDSNVEELANEEDSQSFFDSFILKFHFIGDIFSIIRQLFADITNDAATVTFVDNGDLPIGDLSNQHFPVSGSPVPVGTAPQVLIKFPSDTYHGADLSGYSAIDMSWYAPYKSRVDALISGFLWIGYLWLLFKRAPGIVRGAAMIEETNYKIEDWKNGG